MKKIFQSLSFCLVFLVVSLSSKSQDLTGIWRGYFITDFGDQYKYEVQIGQSKKLSLTGVTYSYLDTRFYAKATLNGFYKKGSNAALVQEIKTLEVKMAGGSVSCTMKCQMEYSRSGKEEFLEGIFTSLYEKSEPMAGIRRGGNCGGGKVFLRKVTTSDFYVEPFLRNKKIIPPTPLAPPVVVEKKPMVTPKQTTVKNKNNISKDKPADPIVKAPIQQKAITVDSVERKPITAMVTAKPVEKISAPVTIRDRKNELTRTIGVTSREILISLYDNGEVDDDTISVYLDGRMILANKRLSTKPILYTLKLNETSPEHTLTMVAENMGRIPPNTSLMIIQDGEKRYEVSITSTEQKNAMVRFRYQEPIPHN